MRAQLIFGEPVVVAQGPTWEEAGWGPYQFPAIQSLPDGRIAVSYSAAQDRAEDYGKERGWSISADQGKTWQAVSPEDLPAVKARFGTRLPSGRYIRAIQPRPVPIDPQLHASLSRKMGQRKFCLGMEEIPEGLFEKYKWMFAVSEPDSPEEHIILSDLDFPGMTTTLTTGAIVRPFPFGNIRLAPDGSLWIAHYYFGRDPESMGFTSYYASYYFRSDDEGRSFHLRGWLLYRPDLREFPDAFIAEGLCEPDICFMPDGSMITLLRTGSRTPSYIARSVDGGRHWSEPKMFDRCGVLPQLLRLGCGVTLASYGRPGLYVRASTDPSGMQWDEPYELRPYRPDRLIADGCSYTQMLPLSDCAALLAYTDFNVPDAQGIRRKSVMVRSILAETL